mgnify:CR=1 FL=1
MTIVKHPESRPDGGFPMGSIMRRRLAAGFTLLELLVVMTIIVTLATIALVQYRQSVQLAREAVLKDDLFKMRDAIDQYYADKNQYPPTLDDLVSAGYIRALPKDPITNSTSSWQAVPAQRKKRLLHDDSYPVAGERGPLDVLGVPGAALGN